MAGKPWDNIVNGLTFGIGFVTVTALVDYFAKIMMEKNATPPTVAPPGMMPPPPGPPLDDPNYVLYGYVEPMNPNPTPAELLAYGDERYTPGLSYYAFDIMNTQTRTPEEQDRNTVDPVNFNVPAG